MEKEQKEEIIKRAFFEYVHNPTNVFTKPEEGIKYACPCCGYKTLAERGGYDICPVCFWEDDGQDEVDATTKRFFGPNHMSLAQARENYRTIGAIEERFLEHVRLPLSEEG